MQAVEYLNRLKWLESEIEKLEDEAGKIDEAMKAYADEMDEKKAQLEKELADIEEFIAKTFEILNDPEQVRNYAAPDLEWLKDENDPLFLVDQVSKLADDDNRSVRSKKSKGKKK